jgi:hypothetical protein
LQALTECVRQQRFGGGTPSRHGFSRDMRLVGAA